MLFQIVFGSGVVNFLIWALLFLTSTAALAIAFKLLGELRRKKFLLTGQAEEIQTLCDQDDLDAAWQQCNRRQTLFARSMSAVFRNFRLGPENRENAAVAIIDSHSRAILRHLQALSLCANIAPMLGLLGTVTGMVSAFTGLGSAMGPEKASVLAISISQALYTTAAGLLIAVPAIAFGVLMRNLLEVRIGEVTERIGGVLNSFLER